MSNVKLKYKLGVVPVGDQYEVRFQILDQDERFRSRAVGDAKGYKARNGLQIESEDRPELTDRTIFIRGFCKDKDNRVARKSFSREQDAFAYVTRVKEALQDWADHWCGFDLAADLPTFCL